MASGRIPSVEGGIQPTIVDAKGDLIVGTAADTVNRLAVGTNEQRLVAASGETTGLKYVADTTNYAIAAKGDLLVGTAADTVTALSVGTNNYVLTADSAEASGIKWAAAGYTTAWTSYTATTSSITVGNGSLTTEYFKQGTFVAVRFRFKLGSTSSIGSSPFFRLPFAASDANRGVSAQVVLFDDNTNGIYDSVAQIAGNEDMYFYACNASGTYTTGTQFTATVPFTWATDDSITTQFVYEAA